MCVREPAEQPASERSHEEADRENASGTANEAVSALIAIWALLLLLTLLRAAH
jgi:hypothetical protein